MSDQTSFHIRPYHPADLPALYRICLHTADNGNDATHLYTDPDMVGHYWAAPYAQLEPDLCFVLTKDHRPVGYVLGTQDTATFGQRCETEWFPPLRERYLPPANSNTSPEASLARLIHQGHEKKNHFPDYPAHLHIDILPAGQGVGMGGKLMRTFLNKLRDLGASGVHLGVGADNKNAVGYYRHIGFHELSAFPTHINFGMKLQ